MNQQPTNTQPHAETVTQHRLAEQPPHAPTTHVRICEDVQDSNLRQLAVQVCLRAIKELKGRDVFAALDAFLWLMGKDFPTWAEVANIPFADVFQLLTSGRLRKLKNFGGDE